MLLASVYTDVEYVAAPQYYVAIIGGGRITPVLRSALKDDVHVAVGVYHFPAVLYIVLEPDVHFGVEFLHQQIERFP